MSSAGRDGHVWPVDLESAHSPACAYKEVLLAGALHRQEAWRKVQKALRGGHGCYQAGQVLHILHATILSGRMTPGYMPECEHCPQQALL